MIKPAKRLEGVSEYYFSKKLKQIKTLEKNGKKIINLGIGSPDLLPSKESIAALVEGSSLPNANGYQSYTGIPEFREQIARWMEKVFKVQKNAESEILPLVGSKEGIMHLSLAYLNEGDGVLIPNPGYPTYKSVSDLCGANILYYDLLEGNDYQPDLEELNKLPLDKVKLMWLNYPHMPTGTKAKDEVFEALIDWAKTNSIVLVHDNPYSLLLNESPKSIFQYAGAESVALELHSLSKSHNMAGWRVGWVTGHQDFIQNILRVKSNMDSGMYLPLQLAAIEALKNEASWHSKNNLIYSERKVIARAIMDQLQCQYRQDDAGMFVWGRIPETTDSAESLVDQILLEKGVFITPGSIFGTNGERYIRISLCQPKEILQEALDLISA